MRRFNGRGYASSFRVADDPLRAADAAQCRRVPTALLDGRAVVASYQMRGRRGQFSGTPPLAAADSNDAAPTAYQPTFFFCGDQR
jgi:hypothetical protein